MKLSEWLQKSGIKPSRFAKEIGISPATICAFLQGKSGLSLETAKTISKGTYGAVSLEDLTKEHEVQSH
jgi:plasmid maintenance system antidote protein VapI